MNGSTDKYVDFYHTKEWKQARLMALTRDHYLCQECYRQGKVTTAKTVHHIKHLRDDWDKRLDLNNLETICLDCHNKEHPEKAAKNKDKAVHRHNRQKNKNIFRFKSNDDDSMLF